VIARAGSIRPPAHAGNGAYDDRKEMAKNIVACCDGTGNEVGGNLSNVMKLFRIVTKSPEQRVYYNPGIGTIGSCDQWARLRQNAKAVFGLATGYRLDADLVGAYRFLCELYEEGDRIFLFGFSRGAYTVRAVAGLVHMVGVLRPDQCNIADYAVAAYKRAGLEDDLKIASSFGQMVSSRRAPIRLVGAWDTVASILAPGRGGILPTLQTLPFTARNPSVQSFRHAMAIDERRRMFRLNRWKNGQAFDANRFDSRPAEPQDIKQVWFAGVHADIGGGYPEAESGLSKFPLDWMIDEALACGLKINVAMRNHLVRGAPRPGGAHSYVAPDPRGDLHDSLTWGWKPLEWLPKSARWREWDRPVRFGCYLPRAEPRVIADAATLPLLHWSVLERVRRDPAYRPVNLPDRYEEVSGPAPA
jgi:uncharacterized protein (DUF2235 family)